MKTWVLLRGLGRDKRHFGQFLAQFKQAFINDKIITIDTLGNGEFRHLKSPTNIAQYTDHCRQKLNQIHNNQPIELVALSLGGMVGIDWANRFPTQINSLTIMNTSAANLTPPYRRMKISTLARLLYAFVIDRSPKAIESAIIKATSNQSDLDSIIHHWTDIRLAGATSTRNMICQLLAAATFKAAPSAGHKVLILTSQHDNIVNHQASHDLQQFFDCDIHIHPSAGHDLSLIHI